MWRVIFQPSSAKFEFFLPPPNLRISFPRGRYIRNRWFCYANWETLCQASSLSPHSLLFSWQKNGVIGWQMVDPSFIRGQYNSSWKKSFQIKSLPEIQLISCENATPIGFEFDDQTWKPRKHLQVEKNGIHLHIIISPFWTPHLLPCLQSSYLLCKFKKFEITLLLSNLVLAKDAIVLNVKRPFSCQKNYISHQR